MNGMRGIDWLIQTRQYDVACDRILSFRENGHWTAYFWYRGELPERYQSWV